MEQNTIKADLLVAGAGISGMTAALEAAETGYKAVLIEKNPYVGGRVAQLNQFFPKLCPPSCGLEINIQRLRDNKNISLYTMTEIQSVEQKECGFIVKIIVKPRYIKDDCMKIDDYIKEISIEKSDEFNFGLNKSKVIYRPYSNSFPQHYLLDKEACTPSELHYLAGNYKDMIDLGQQEQQLVFLVKSIVWATGWVPYDASKIGSLSYSKYPEVITNVEMERLASPMGPTTGRIIIPGTVQQPKKVVFVQCAGSRDENHLEYCSSVCCLAALKQAQYIREQIPECEVHLFYIDVRATGIFEDFYANSKKDEKLHLHRGKVAKIFKEYGSTELTVEAEDTLAGSLNQLKADLVVLSTGMKPDTSGIDKSLLDRNGFFRTDTDTGQYGCGVCTMPKDVASAVQESTGAAMKAIINIRRSQ